jgi:pilus assembly protein CpaE
MADEQLRVLIVEDSEVTARALTEMVNAQPDMDVIGVAPTGQEAVRRAGELRPDVVLMDIHLPDIDGLQATWLIASKNPDSSVIMVTSEERIEYVQRAMVAGAQGYLVKPIKTAADLAATIRTVRQRALERRSLLTHPGAAAPTSLAAPPSLGKRIAVFSPKGGQGKTTIAVNLAVMLRVMTEQQVLLVDANLRFGDANILLDLPFERSIADLLPSINQLDSDLLDQVLAKHPSGLQVLMRPERPETAETIMGSEIETVLTILPRLFDYIVVDCEVSYDEKMLAVLDYAELILLVLTPELGAVRNAKYFLQLTEALGYPRHKIAYVLNRADSHVGFRASDVEQALNCERMFRLDSYGRMLATSLNMGKPAVLRQPRSPFARAIAEIAEYVQQHSNGTR